MNARAIVFAGAGFVATLAAGWLGYPRLFYREVSQPMAFNHLAHTGEKAGLTCDGCHRMSDDGRFEGIPPVSVCAECHQEPLGSTDAERMLVEEYIRPQVEIEWRSYWRQPDNAWFPHAVHVSKAAIGCAECHGEHGTSESLGVVGVNRLSGYPMDVDRVSLATLTGGSAGMRMDRCTGCHEERGLRTGCIACHK